MKFIEKYIELRSMVKKVRLEKLKQNIFLLTEENWNVRKKFSRISVGWRWNPATIGSHSKLESRRRLQEDYKVLSQTNCNLRSGVFTFSCFVL